MNDTVKLIIEIPKEIYEQIKDGIGETRYKIPLWLCHSIFCGTPLEDVKAEIEQLRLHKAEFLTNDNKVCIDSQTVLDVLDNIGKESEVKPNE